MNALRQASFERHLASKELLVLSGEHTGSPLHDGITMCNGIAGCGGTTPEGRNLHNRRASGALPADETQLWIASPCGFAMTR